jgi:hypothetical protein
MLFPPFHLICSSVPSHLFEFYLSRSEDEDIEHIEHELYVKDFVQRLLHVAPNSTF